MKRLKLWAFAPIFLSVLALAHLSYADEDEVKVRVDGLSCPFCVVGLKGKLAQVESLKDIQVDYKKGLVIARWDPNKPFNEESIRKAVSDAGFSPREIFYEGKKTEK